MFGGIYNKPSPTHFSDLQDFAKAAGKDERGAAKCPGIKRVFDMVKTISNIGRLEHSMRLRVVYLRVYFVFVLCACLHVCMLFLPKIVQMRFCVPPCEFLCA